MQMLIAQLYAWEQNPSAGAFGLLVAFLVSYRPLAQYILPMLGKQQH